MVSAMLFTDISFPFVGERDPGRVARLGKGRPRAWLARVDDWRPHLESLHEILDESERTRVARLRVQGDREARTVAYGLHRALVAAELGIAPQAVPLYRDASGRPRVAGDAVWTSLSHADGWVAVAVDACGPIGIDVEPVDRAPVMDEVADSVVHPAERGLLTVCDARSRRRALLALWVRKEAVLKALGVGLQVDMASFTAMAGRASCVPGLAGKWHVHDIELEPDVQIALACAGNARPLGASVPACGRRDAAIAPSASS